MFLRNILVMLTLVTPKCCFIFAAILALMHASNCLTFLNRSESYAEYPAWNSVHDGRLQLEFRTYLPTSLLLYAEEISKRPSDERSFMKVSLLNGRLNVIIQMGGEDERSKKHVLHYGNLNDMKWHKLVIIRDKNKTKLSIDGHPLVVVNDGEQNYLPLNSSLFIGGVNSKVLKNPISNLPYTRFVGCIQNLAYSTKDGFKRPESILSSALLAPGCANECEKYSNSPCKNGGKCLNRFTSYSCNCLGTGYKGYDCTIPTMSAYFRGLDYITWSLSRHSSMPRHHIILRFKTFLENGILFATEGSGDFIILELFEGLFRMSIDLGGGPLEIKAGDKSLNDRQWHKVEIIRRNKFCIVILDDRLIKNGTTPGRNRKFDFAKNKKMYFAGYANASTLTISKSKQNFSGCMQDIFYNQYNILNLKFNQQRIEINTVGSVQRGCPVFTPPPTTTTTMQQSTTTESVATTATTFHERETSAVITPSIIKNGNFESQNGGDMTKEPLSKSQIAWITSGIIVGALILVFTTACLVHRCKQRYDGVLISSALKNKENRHRPNQRYKGERVVFLEHGTKEKLDKVTKF